MGKRLSVGIIGAGVAGLTCAGELRDRCDITLLDKGPGIGGRVATRRGNGVRFTHGAQSLPASTAAMQQRVDAWQSAGVIEQWTGRYVHWTDGRAKPADDGRARYVGVGGMSALPKHLAGGLNVLTSCTIARVESNPAGWLAHDAEGASHGPFDVLIITAPPAQASLLIGTTDPFTHALHRARLLPTWAFMIQTDPSSEIAFDAARVQDREIVWAMRNPEPTSHRSSCAWVAHAGNAWSQTHLDHTPEQVVALARETLAQLLGDGILQIVAHRWRYAHCDVPVAAECLWDSVRRLGLCGDWCVGPKIESAVLSGRAMAGRVRAMLE